MGDSTLIAPSFHPTSQVLRKCSTHGEEKLQNLHTLIDIDIFDKGTQSDLLYLRISIILYLSLSYKT